MLTDQQRKLPISILERFGLPVRVVNFLERKFGTVYISELDSVSVSDLRACRNMGPKAVSSLQASLRALAESGIQDVDSEAEVINWSDVLHNCITERHQTMICLQVPTVTFASLLSRLGESAD